MPFFEYGPEATDYLSAKDPVLGEIIRAVGPVRRAVTPDLFQALVNSIVGQQIATKAHQTIWRRMEETLGDITPQAIIDFPPDELQALGMSHRKVAYIRGIAEEVLSGRLDLVGLQTKSDEEVCQELCKLKGVGRWTAEMLMIFSMQRPDILSFGDLAIVRGVRMVYHHRRVDEKLFEKYRRRYSPYGSVASLYLWAAAGGAVEGLRDYAPKAR